MIDAHQHFVFPDKISYPDLELAMPEINRAITPDDLAPQLRESKVDGTVLVQAANDIAETRMMLDVAAQVDWVTAVVGWVPLDDPDTAAAALDGIDNPCLAGLRYLIHRQPEPRWLSDPARLDALRVVAGRGLVYELVALAKGHLDNAVAIVEHVPELTLIIDHLGGPHVRGERWEPWASIVRAAAQHERCMVKYSGLDPVDGSVEAYRPYVEHVFAEFGPDRVLWASNWPATRLGGSYKTIVDDSFALLPALSSAERDAVFGTNTRRVYGLPR